MKTVEKIINLLGGLEALKRRPIKLEAPGFMPLCIEYVGEGPRKLPLVSVADYGQQNGDPMRDPDMVFEVDFETGMGWGPVECRNDFTGTHQEAVFVADDGRVMIRPRLVKDLKAFARVWDRNINQQGFYAAAQRLAAAREPR